MVVVKVSFWALVIFGLMAVFGGTGEGKDGTRTPNLDSQDILRERFARGEFDADEYDDRHKTLLTRE